MSTYLKNMVGYKHNQLKNKIFDDIQKLFDIAMKRVNIFVDMDTKLVEGSAVRVEGSSKRARKVMVQESSKKQKIDDDQEAAKMKELMDIAPDKEEVTIDAIPLATKPLSIIDWKIIKEGKISNFQIIRADGSSKRPEEGHERVLSGDLKTMFEHHVEDTVWRNLQGQKVLIWKLFDFCGVHFVRLQSMHIFMLVEKRYPLTPATITEMLNKKLQADHWNEIVTAAKVRVTAAKQNLVVFNSLSENYAKYTARVKLVLLVNIEENILNIVMSDSEDSTVTYTEVSSPIEDLSDIGSLGVDGLPMMPEDPYAYVDEVFPAEEQPLPTAVSPTTDLPGYIADSDPEDPEEDPADYPADEGDNDDDDNDEDNDDDVEVGVFEVTLPPRKRLCIALGLRYEVGESSYAPTARPTIGAPTNDDTELGRRMTDFVMTVRQDTNDIYGRLDDAQDDRLLMSGRLNMLFRDRRAHARIARLIETKTRPYQEQEVAGSRPQEIGPACGDIDTDEDTANTGDSSPESEGTR
ncbi:hypothetical protein Tco_0621949 [Tanacetum coccineum]